jgi:ERCC4-related helicase
MVEFSDLDPREYQLKIAETCVRENTLVVLPTGLGKTIIALIAVALRLGDSSDSKALVLAPTKPLASQHMKTFMKHLKLEKKLFTLLTGEIEPHKRTEAWNNSRIIFATPQTVYNDVISGRSSLRNFVIVVFDEAHRSVRDYTYTKLAEIYMTESASPRIVGLTASPGGDISRVNEITRNLFIKKVEIRTEKDEDVKEYLEGIVVEHVRVSVPEEYNYAISLMKNMLKKRLDKLRELNLLEGNNVSKRTLLELGSYISNALSNEKERKQRGYLFNALLNQIQAVTILHALELLQTQGSYAFYRYIKRLEERSSRSIRELLEENEWATVKKEAERIVSFEHTKYDVLVKELRKQLQLYPNSRVLVFAQYRDTIEHLVQKLEQEGFLVKKFVGQAHREGSEGMDQREQQEVLEGFSAGRWNVLVSSSIGEEGLHVPDVELVVFYDAVPSEIRAIQRRGRTGRNKQGRVLVLLAEGTMDISYYYSSIIKERRMKRIIYSKEIKQREPTLFDFT